MFTCTARGDKRREVLIYLILPPPPPSRPLQSSSQPLWNIPPPVLVTFFVPLSGELIAPSPIFQHL